MGPAGAAARAGDDEDTDVLEIVERRRAVPVPERLQPGSRRRRRRPVRDARKAVPQCLRLPGLVLLREPTTLVHDPGGHGLRAAPRPAPAGLRRPNGNLTLTATSRLRAVAGLRRRPTPIRRPNVVYLYRARLVRYRVAPNPDPLDPTPALWRTRERPLRPPTARAAPEPGAAGFNAAGSPWQIVARGIEDLQIEYRDGNGVWQNQPPVSLADNWTTLVRQVRITLSARASAGQPRRREHARAAARRTRCAASSAPSSRRAPAFYELQMWEPDPMRCEVMARP